MPIPPFSRFIHCMFVCILGYGKNLDIQRQAWIKLVIKNREMMCMITILTDKVAEDLSKNMHNEIIKTRSDIKHFCVENMRIEPCYACRHCEEKTYKRCVIRDDADLILPYLARSKTIVIFTPIVYGGYSFQIKRIVDRFSLLVSSHYYIYDGELVKGKSTGINYYVIGAHDGADAEEIQAFKQLVMETIKIAAWRGKPFIMPQDADEYENLIKEVSIS